MQKWIPLLASLAGAYVTLVEAAPAKAEDITAKTYVHPTQKALDAMAELPMDEPIHMLNLIRLKDNADYEEGSEFAAKNWTGAEAFAKYRSHIGPIVKRLGGGSIYDGQSQLTLIGPELENWDSVFIIYYPNTAAMIAMNQDPEYQKHAFHRMAAVADSRLIRIAE
ncbi:MAG: DUF1330 domain-containing protein [Henriciella sp.]